ncbi:MAG: PilZ domain-containing protein [Spirochaetota bacterium]
MAVDAAGKKVFLLNPPSVVGEELIHAILAAEYELYVLKDPVRALRVFQKFPDSIVFVNIDADLAGQTWEQYVRRLVSEKTFANIRVGILSYNPEAKLIERYLMEIGVQCGFVKVKLGVQESTRIILQALEANEARGRRKYVRARCANDTRTGFNVDVSGQRHEGRILDVSSVGMAIRFDKPVDLAPKSSLPDIQLRLRATLVRVDGVVLGRREDDKSIYVILFRHHPHAKARRQIREYVHKSLQEYIDKLMEG